MYSINSEDVSYIVPMDHVDLKVLKRWEQIGDSVKPLWSPRQQEYAEFQLKAWRAATNDEEHYDANEKKTTCHICNAQVPINYLKEHINSKKHRNYLTIIDEAITRLRSNINMNPPAVSPTETSKSTYFCEACCLSVLKNNKELHEESATHKNSTKHDEIIENLLKAFKHNDKNNSNDVIDTSMDGNNNAMPKNLDLEEATPLVQLKDYINALKHKMSPDPLEIEILDENYIIMKVANKSFKINIDQFHSFVKVERGMECLLCNVVVRCKRDHIWTDQHMRWLIRHLADDQCIRQINQYYSHCIICNELIRNINVHKAMNSPHTNKLKTALYITTNNVMRQQVENKDTKENGAKERNNDNIKPVNTEKKYEHYLICRKDSSSNGALCRVCACTIPDNKINIEDHMNGRNHNQKYKNLLSTNQIKQVHDGYSCNFCRIHVPKMTELEHILSKDHKTKMGSVNTTHQTYCQSCKVYIDTHNLEGHLKGQKHQQNARQTGNDIAKSNTVDASKTFAMATSNSAQDKGQSKSTEPNSSQNMHVKNIQSSAIVNMNSSVPENSKIDQTANESIQPSTSNINVKSKISQIPPENKNIQAKTSVVKPKKNINQFSISGTKTDQNSTQMKNIQTLMSTLDINSTTEKQPLLTGVTNEPSTSQAKIPTEQKIQLHYQFKETTTPKQLLCRVCKKTVPNTTDNISTHINGANHTNNYKNLLELNKVVQSGSNFHCNKCNVDFTNKNEIDHILGNRHKNALSDDTASITSDRSSNTEQIKTTEYKSKLYLFRADTLFPNHISCKVCHTMMFNTIENVINHANGVRHLNEYNSFLKLKGIDNLEDGFFCNFCSKNVTKQNELLHVDSDEHKSKYLRFFIDTSDEDDSSNDDDFNDGDSSDSESYEVYCGFCEIFVPGKAYFNHNISVAHNYQVGIVSNGALVTYYYRETLKSYLQCNVCHCNVNNEYQCALEHINGSRHQARV